VKANESRIGQRKCDLLTPFRRPFLDFSNTAFVSSLKAEVKAPDAANPAKKDCSKKNNML
jgi:hypothetical protein